MIDFTEIKNGYVFEDLVFEIFNRKPEVKDIKKTGKGTDFGADITFTLEIKELLLESTQQYKAIVECKHNAKSKKSVGKNDINIYESLSNHGALVYFLVTSTNVTNYVAKTINSASGHEILKDFRLKYLEKTDLERELLREENEDIFMRFLPINYKEVIKIRDISTSSFNELKEKVIKQVHIEKPDENTKETIMKNVYIIRNSIDSDVLQENRLKKIAKDNDIELYTSQDVIEDWIFSFEQILSYNKFIDSADSIFGIITSKSSKSPNVWIETERALSRNKLKLIFIEEDVYSILRHSEYPCIIIKKNLEETIQDFENQFRTVFQDWGNTNNDLFWFSLDIILSIYASKSNTKIHEPN